MVFFSYFMVETKIYFYKIIGFVKSIFFYFDNQIRLNWSNNLNNLKHKIERKFQCTLLRKVCMRMRTKV